MTSLDRALLQFECRKCGAGRGRWCWNLRWRNTPARDLHGSRWHQARSIAEALGYLGWLDELSTRMGEMQQQLTVLIREAAGRGDNDLIGKLKQVRGW